jgi:hypothetical protein
MLTRLPFVSRTMGRGGYIDREFLSGHPMISLVRHSDIRRGERTLLLPYL